MPELPEVETYVRELEALLTGRTIAGAEVRWRRTLAAPEVEHFVGLIVGRRFERFGRRGKYMLLGLDDGLTLIVHLRMTGNLTVSGGAVSGDLVRQYVGASVDGGESFSAKATPTTDVPTTDVPTADVPTTDAPNHQVTDPHVHLILTLADGGMLRFRDPRKFGRIWLVEDPASVVGDLGPEPWDPAFSPASFAARLSGRKATIKALLLDQRMVAGVGNIYADEALFAAAISPLRPASTLTLEEIATLQSAIRTVLEGAIRMGGSSLGDGSTNYTSPSGAAGAYQGEHRVYGRTEQPCYRCGAPILRTVIAQRGTHYCGVCQR